jgi:hypothetical protein
MPGGEIVRKFGRDNPYYAHSTPELKTRLFALIREMRVRPLPKNLRLGELVEWVITELPKVAPDDPRTQEAFDLANVLWEHSRD